LTCEERDGRVTLRGRVPTQYLQTFADSLVRAIDGVREVSNQIEVVLLNPPPAPAPSREW
jgi:osmotically-inducible protein OsmY